MQTILTQGRKWAWPTLVALWQFTGHAAEPAFTNVTATVTPDLPQVGFSAAGWADYDTDGRLDFLITGRSFTNLVNSTYPVYISQVWRNTESGFTNVPGIVASDLPGVNDGLKSWGDYDNDGRLDFLLTGYDYNNFSSLVWRNFTPLTNTPPSAPTGLAMTATATAVMLSWHSATDGHTSASGLTYKVRAGTTPGGNDFLAAHVNATNGFRRVPAMGNAMLRHSLPLTGLTNGQTVYWSVQAVDTAFPGGPFATKTNLVSTGFENVTASVAPGLPRAWGGPMAWGDFDNDGWLDLFVTGTTVDENGDVYPAQLWRNTGSGFTNVTDTLAPGMVQMKYYDAAWGDYDNDGRLDLIATSYDDGISLIWRNTPSGFTNVTDSVAPGLPQVQNGAVAWGDFDNDGRLDFLLTGGDGGPLSQLWRNTGSSFSNVTATVVPGLPGVGNSAVAWGDYDNDGWLDFLLTGWSVEHGFTSQLWRNSGEGFANVTDAVAPGLPGVADDGSVAWGDYDNDGRLDFLLTGVSSESVKTNDFISQLWRNTGTGFTNVTANLAPGLLGLGKGSWGDFDNDGLLDFLLTGYRQLDGFKTQLWRNTGSGFTNVTSTVAPGLLGSGQAAAAWGDYDNDGRLDILLPGIGVSNFMCQLWRNNTPNANTPPSAPTGLAMTATTNAVMFSWHAATDGQTPASGLTYNVRAGTTPGGNDLLAAHVNATNGFRRVPALGNAMLRHSLPLTGLTNGQTVYWSVQAVDTAFAGGPFANETSVVSLPLLRITRPDTTNAVVSWTPPTFGWVLQQSPSLTASNWTTASSGSANPTTLLATNAAQFYRLSKP